MNSKHFDKFAVCCRDHPGARLVKDMETGDMICPECGLVIGDRLVEETAEWRNFSGTGIDRSRVGQAEDPASSDGNLYTIIGPATGPGGMDSRGISKYFRYSTEAPAQKALKAAYRMIEDACSRLNLPPNVAESACSLYQQITEKKLSLRAQKEPKLMACIYICCRQEDVPRPFREICNVSGLPNAAKKIGKAWKDITRSLGLHDRTEGKELPILERLCSQLNLPRDVMAVATKMLPKITEADCFAQKKVDTICAAAIMLVSALLGKATATPVETVLQLSNSSHHALSTSYRNLRNEPQRYLPDDAPIIVPFDELPLSIDHFPLIR